MNEKNVIRTRWSSSRSEDLFAVDDPATGEVFAHVQGSDEAQTDAAVRAAHQAFLEWRWRPARERGQLLMKASQHIAAHADELAELLTRENGKPLRDSRRMDVNSLMEALSYFGMLADKAPGEALDMGLITATTVREPFGVVAGIIPFNWPPIHVGAKVGPALATGNTIVLKPGDQAPLTIMRIVDLLNEVLPADILHVLPGAGPAVGKALAAHPLVRKISFTGAPSTGSAILKAVADRHVPVLLELGGKNPFIVFNDADIDRAVGDALDAAFFNKGEACTAASRILVQAGIYDAFAERFATAVRRLKLGDGRDASTHVGPLISRAQQQKVLDYIKTGVEEGATIIAEGELPTEERLRNGYFVKPTLFGGMTSDMRIAQEEIFGPVTGLMKFETEDQAVEIANGTAFALVTAIYTGDAARANRVARRVEAGVMYINNFVRSGGSGSPFGGTKASGYGRERAAMTMNEFTYAKALRMPSGLGEMPQWDVLKDILDH